MWFIERVNRQRLRCHGPAHVIIALVALMSCQLTLAAENEAAQPTRRTSARIIRLHLPDFPDKLLNPGSFIEVRLRLSIDEDGQVAAVVVVSPPTPVDEAVVEAAKRWFVIPDVCTDSKWTSMEVRTSVVFSAEEGRQFVTVKDPRWYAIGSDDVLPQAGTNERPRPFVKMQPKPKTPFPNEALARGIKEGVVAAVVQFDGTGKPTEILRMFQWPNTAFESVVRKTVMKWNADPDDPSVKEAKPFRACFEFTFELK